jgi:hypothetical protein
MPVKRVPAPVKDELLTGTVKQEAVNTWGKRNRRGQRAGGVFEKEIALRHCTPVCPQRGCRYTLAASLSTATLDRPMHMDRLARYRACSQASLAGVCHHLPFDVCDICWPRATLCASGIAGARCLGMAADLCQSASHGAAPSTSSNTSTQSIINMAQTSRSRNVLTICCHHYKRHCAAIEH